MKTIKVNVDNKSLQVAPGTTIRELFGRVTITEREIVAANLNNNLVGLNTKLNGRSKVMPIYSSDPSGISVLRQSIAHMLHSVVLENHPGLELITGQSLLGGYFYEVKNTHQPVEDLAELAKNLTDNLEELVARELPFEIRSIPVDAAKNILTDPSGSKAKLLRTWASPVISIVTLGKFTDIMHGPYAPSTWFGAGAEVIPYKTGLILKFPGASEIGAADHGQLLWESYRETREWNRRLGVETVSDLNHAILDDRLADVIRIAEAQHEKKIAAIADLVASRRNRINRIRILCAAGPSSAGKTTFVQRLQVQLRVNAIEPIIINLDDYFLAREELKPDEKGELDFEALETLNVELIREHAQELLAGREIRVPKYDFVAGKPVPPDQWRPIRLQKEQVIIFEGIHGLNPELFGHIQEGAVFRIFVNALTQLVIDEHNRLFTADVRLLRRIVRDRRYRGYKASATIKQWPSVQRGEMKHIFPFQETADAMFNSALVYETAVLKVFAWRFLLEIPPGDPAQIEAYRLLRFLDLFVPVFPEGVPANSVLREFIGGSGFYE